MSLGENIRVGFQESLFVKQKFVEDAAKKGGAYDWIKQLERGFDTIVSPVQTCGYGPTQLTGLLRKEWKNHLQTPVQMSRKIQPFFCWMMSADYPLAGERQRLSASVNVSPSYVKLNDHALDRGRSFDWQTHHRD